MRGNTRAFFTSTLIYIAIVTMPAMAWAQPKMVVTTVIEKQVKDEKGNETGFVETKDVKPGDVARVRIRYRNEGDQDAFKVKFTNPIPKGTAYIDNSAAGKDATITFSVDGGKTYKQAATLLYEMVDSNGRKTKRKAEPSDYTHVQWVVKRVAKGASGEVSYQYRVQ